MKLLLFFALLCAPAFAFAESIPSFASNIVLERDGSFLVTETIQYDFESEYRHGIFRFILKTHPQEATSNWKERYLDIDVQSVLMDGNEVPFEVTESGGEVEVKIGDPDRTISGVHAYEIEYAVTGGYSYFDDGSVEIYWNATGNDWHVPIMQASVTLYGADLLKSDSSACYAGAYGQTDACSTQQSDDGAVTFIAENLDPGEGLTIAHELNKETVQRVVLEKLKWWLVFLIAIPLLLIAASIYGYRYKTAHRTGRPIIAQYEPYESFKPMYSGMLFDGRLDPQDIAAGIVYLAEQGFLKIKKTEKKVLFLFEVDDYEVTLMKRIADIESAHLRDVATLLFNVSDMPGTSVSLSGLKSNTSKQTANSKLLLDLYGDLKKDMQASGFYQVNTAMAQLVLLGLAFAVALFLLAVFLIPEAFILLIVVAVFGTVLLLVIYERRTRKGYEALDHLKGFKLFLSTTEKERYAFHNAPQKSPEQFMEYLPYAIAFGVEKQWAEVFKDLTIPDPVWYDGGTVGHFSAINLTNSLGAFSTALAASSTSSASSSGGSGGGGFSGGGGGGGGGGSW